MVSADSWRKKRTVDFTAPSGDVYTIEKPDPISLIQFWIKECHVEAPLDQKDLGDQILKNPKIVAQMLMRYIKSPKIEAEPTDSSLGINELMQDQVDSIAILREVMSPFLTQSDAMLNFFRNLELSATSGRT